MPVDAGYGTEDYGVGGYGISTGTMTKTASLTLVAEEQGEVRIQINDKESGTGVEGFTVELAAVDGSDFTATETTDGSGLAVFEAVRVRDYDVTATKSGWFDATGLLSASDFTADS